jgi:hypothetical protein
MVLNLLCTILQHTTLERVGSQFICFFLLQKHGIRAKLLTEDNNEIDTMFVDRRADKTRHGNTLVNNYFVTR